MKYIPDVATLILKTDQCVGCGMCATVCPHRVFEMQNKKAVIIDKDRCMECGACMRNCPVSAVMVRTGVGCAAGILSYMLGGTDDCCCSPSGESSDSGCNGGSCCG